MRIAVVILNWNGKALLEQFLPSIVEHSKEADIYVADNCSTDSSIDFLTMAYPTIRIIRNIENFGFAKGYNEALKSVDADVFALVNSDIEVTENWLHPIIKSFQEQPEVSIIQPKILDFKNKEFFEYAGAAGGFIDKYGYPFCRGRIFETIEKDVHQYDDAVEIFWASGACMFIRANVFNSLQGFDTDFFAHQEEIDLCWRAFNLGHQIKFEPSSTVYHVGGATLNTGHPRKTYLNFRNSLLMLHKNLPSKNMYNILFMRLVFDGLAGVRFLFQGKPKHVFAIIQAHGGFYKLLRRNQLKRKHVQRSDYYTVENILTKHFLKKINTYNRLF